MSSKRYKLACAPIEDSDQPTQSDQSSMGTLWVAKEPTISSGKKLKTDQAVRMHSH